MEKLLLDNRSLIRRCAGRYQWALKKQAVVDMDDLMQTGALAVLEAAQSFDPARGGWEAWAALCIHQAMRRELGILKAPETRSLDEAVPGSEGLTLGDVLPDPSIAPSDDALLRSETAKALRDAVQEISDPVQRSAFELTQLRGFTAAGAAETLGVTPGTIYALNARTRRQLRRSGRLSLLTGPDDLTCFGARKSASAFLRDHTSIVETAVLRREQLRKRIAALRGT